MSCMMLQAILGAPMGIVRILDLLGDPHEVIRNETVLLLASLTRSSADIQKIAAFEGAFEHILKILACVSATAKGTVLTESPKRAGRALVAGPVGLCVSEGTKSTNEQEVLLQGRGLGFRWSHCPGLPGPAFASAEEQSRQPAYVQVRCLAEKLCKCWNSMPISEPSSWACLSPHCRLCHVCQCMALQAAVLKLMVPYRHGSSLHRDVGHMAKYVRALQLPADKHRRSLPKQIGINLLAAMGVVQQLISPAASSSAPEQVESVGATCVYVVCL